jgi:chromosome segregation protein
MRLEKIVLNGFKSFADTTEFPLRHGITAIVGPNGCGKSNVVDAVKWVLGEQSVKSLRSGQMADVIFTGSGTRKPAGMAEVTLHFSGVTGTLAVEQDELQLTRRLYQSSESEYLINNRLCRLKDIRELFMDTGVGVRAYSIIEQGQIDQLLRASSTERRIIFEEAAGISKYKAHKKEALRKLERTEQNLLRVADILAEVQKQLRSIKLQAGKARNYLEYTQRLKQLRVNLSLAEFGALMTQIQASREVLQQMQQQLSALAAQVSRYDTQASTLGSQIIQTENEINRTDNSLVAVSGKIEHTLDRIRLLQDHIHQQQQRQETLRLQMANLQSQKEQCQQQLQSSENALTDSEAALEQKKQAADELEQLIQQIDRQGGALEAELQDERSGIIDIVRHTAQLHNELQSISTYQDNLAGQKDRLFDRAQAAKAQLEQLLAQKAQRQARSEDIEGVLAELKQNLDEKKQQTEQLEQQANCTAGQIAELREKRSALQGEQAVLQELENKQEGLSTAVKTLLQARAGGGHELDYVQAIVADAIHADAEYANAVEAALEGLTDAVIINDSSRLLRDKSRLAGAGGRVKFICADQLEPFVDNARLPARQGLLGRLVQFVRFDGNYAALAWKLLGHTLLVESLEQAMALHKELAGQYQLVTIDGELVGANGTVSLGPLGRSAGLISRKSRLRQLQESLETLESQAKALDEQQKKTAGQAEYLDKLCQDLRTATYEASAEKVEANSKLAMIEQQIKQLTEEQPLIRSEIDLLEEQIAQSARKQYESTQKLLELETINTQRSAHIQQLEAELTERKKQQQAENTRLTELRVQLGRITEQLRAGKQTVQTLRTQLDNLEQTIGSARTEISTCDEVITQTQRDILHSETVVSDLFAEKETASQTSRTLHAKVQDLLQQRSRTEQLLREKRTEQADVEAQAHQVELELSQLEVKKVDLLQRVQEELQVDLAEAYTRQPLESVDQEAVRAEIAELRAKIERLGNVNVDAIAEQEQLEQRNDFLSRQVEDLNKSKAQLQQLINRINRESRERFQVTFEQIRANFQKVFRRLFGGGKADIFLEDPADVLESGIEIVARPPGKETRSISLLSGGEKVMTALALLFSIFESKPSPFCLLDEVDAALDEANNERFNMIVREFQKHSQFIIITHAKRTMSIADELIGITMQTQGVSKKITVQFDQFMSEASAAVA